MAAAGGSSVFLLMASGQIETLEFPEFDDVFIQYEYHMGQDWVITAGNDSGMTQRTLKSRDDRQSFVLNFPLEVTFKSTNPFGWPQLLMAAWGYDVKGEDVIRGYGMTHIPITPGRHTIKVPMYVPESSSKFQQFLGWFMSRRAEFQDLKTIASGEGREVARVRTQGYATITFNVVMKDMKKMGYDVVPSDVTNPLIPDTAKTATAAPSS